MASFVGFASLDGTRTGLLICRGANRAPAAPTGTPTYRVYGPGNTLMTGGTGNLSQVDAGNLTGAYGYSITCSAVNGYERGQSYNVVMSYVVSSVTYSEEHTFVVQ